MKILTKKKKKKVTEIGAAQMAGPSGPAYDTTGNQRLSETDELADIVKLAGVKDKLQLVTDDSINISMTGSEKSRLMKEYNIRPGDPEWFRLWFARPYMTGEKPIGD